jgi:acetyltransferase
VFALGNSADIDFGELVELLLSDHQTHSILLHVEGIHDARRFLSGLRAAARTKPVLVIKSGRHLAGSRAVLLHTGAPVGWDDAFEAALCRVGAVRVASFNQLFAAARTLSYGVRTRGNRLAIVTNGGGIGVMAADRLADLSLPVPQLGAQTVRTLASVLPGPESTANPVDLSGDATADRYRSAVDICLRAPEVDAVLAILCPQAMTEPQAVAEQMVALAESQSKPLLTCWLGESQVHSSRQLFSTRRVPSYRTPEAAVEAFHVLACYQRNQELLLQVPEPLGESVKPDLSTARHIVNAALADKRGELTEFESRRLLSAFHIPMQKTLHATGASELARMAEETGFPVLLRLDSPERAVRGEHIYVCDSYSLRSAYYRLQATVRKRFPAARIEGVLVAAVPGQHTAEEVAIAVAEDPVFGPVITVSSVARRWGNGRGPAVALPPLNRHLANDLVRNQTIGSSSAGAMENVLLRVSEMVCALPELRTVDLAQVLLSQQAATVSEVRITVRARVPGHTPYAHMAIHPYPTELVCRHVTGPDTIIIRPIRPEDAVIERAFVHALSSRSKYLRFMTTLNELSPEMLSRFTQIDYDREMALIAVTESSGAETELGVARYAANPDGESCEFGLVVADVWQRRGIGRRLMVELMACARRRGLRSMEGEVLRENAPVLALLRSLGFTVQALAGDPEIKAVVKDLLT